MERVAKRFLLHNKRDTEEVKESDFDELKQDVQMIRAEMLNDMRIGKENLLRYTSLLHKGITILTKPILTKEIDSKNMYKYEKLKKHEFSLQNEFSDLFEPNVNRKRSNISNPKTE